MKAYKVTLKDEVEETEIVFANTPGQAKVRACMAEYFIELRAVRAPEFDGCAPCVTEKDFFDQGWNLECARYRSICKADCEDEGIEIKFTKDGNLICQHEAFK